MSLETPCAQFCEATCFERTGATSGEQEGTTRLLLRKWGKKETNNINKIMCSSLYYLLQTVHRIEPVHFDKVPFDDQYAPDARPLVVLSDMLVAWTTFLIGSSVVANIIRSHDSLYAHWCCNLGDRRHIISEGMYLKKLLEPLLLAIRTCLRPALNRCVRWCSVVNEILLHTDFKQPFNISH